MIKAARSCSDEISRLQRHERELSLAAGLADAQAESRWRRRLSSANRAIVRRHRGQLVHCILENGYALAMTAG